MSDEPNALGPQMIDELGFGADLVTTFETSGGGGAGGADAGDACGAGAHDAGIDYGVLAADIAADNMAAHIAAEAEKETAEEAEEEAAAAAARVGVQAEFSGGRRVTTPIYAEAAASPLSHDWSDVLGNIPIKDISWDQLLSEILGFIRRKEPWEIKPEDAKLLLVSRLARGGALQVPSLKHAIWVHKSEPHVFFVEGDGQDTGDIGESDYERVATSGERSHTVTQFPDLIAVKRASCSPGRDTPNPKKVGKWQLALLEGHPDFGSDTFRGMPLKGEREGGYGRDGIKCKLFGPKLVHSVPDKNKKRRVEAGSSSSMTKDCIELLAAKYGFSPQEALRLCAEHVEDFPKNLVE